MILLYYSTIYLPICTNCHITIEVIQAFNFIYTLYLICKFLVKSPLCATAIVFTYATFSLARLKLGSHLLITPLNQFVWCHWGGQWTLMCMTWVWIGHCQAACSPEEHSAHCCWAIGTVLGEWDMMSLSLSMFMTSAKMMSVSAFISSGKAASRSGPGGAGTLGSGWSYLNPTYF